MDDYRSNGHVPKNGTPPLKISNQPEENARPESILSSMMREDYALLANGPEKPSVAVALYRFLDVLMAGRSLVTTVPTSLLVTTPRGTFIVSVTDATTAGTPLTIKHTIGQIQELKNMLQEVSLESNENKPSTMK